MAPRRTVLLIPYFNSAESLLISLSSVDSAEACDVLIVDDGSDQLPLDLAAARAAFRGHGDVHSLVLDANVGIENALNAGLDWIAARDYTYIARLDCGDRNRPGRLRMQEEFLDTHPRVLLVGGAAAFVDLTGHEQFVFRLPTEHDAIADSMRNNSAFMHPSVMFRASALPLVGRYPVDVPAAEDYAFFWKFIEVGEVANLPDVLIDYELDPSGISLSKRTTQLTSRLKVQRAHDDGSWAARLGIARTKVLLRLPYGPVFQAKRISRSLRGRERPSSSNRAAAGTMPLQEVTEATVRDYLAAAARTAGGGLEHGDTEQRACRIALVVHGAVLTEAEQLAVDFCARGTSVRLVPVARTAVATAEGDCGLDAIVSLSGPTPHVHGVPALRFTDADGIDLADSGIVAQVVRKDLPYFEVRLTDTLGSVVADGDVAPRRTVDATLARALRVAGPMLVVAARTLPLPAVPAAAALRMDAPEQRRAIADAFGAAWFIGRIVERVISVRQWQVGRVPGRKPIRELFASHGTPVAPVRWNAAPTPNFWADPHVVTTENAEYLFVEELDMATGRGSIRLLEIDEDEVAPLGVVLRTSHHLSFPQVYRINGRWLATVETCGEVNPVYTFDEIGDPWRATDELPALPPHLADPVLLFDRPLSGDVANTPARVVGLIGTDATVDPDAVVVEYSLADDNSWRRIDESVRVSVTNGRGGGTLDLRRGLRATQDCSGIYGRAIELVEFPEQQPPRVELRVDADTAGPDLRGKHQRGLHTLTWSSAGTTVWADAWHRRLTPFGWLWDRRERQHLDSCQG